VPELELKAERPRMTPDSAAVGTALVKVIVPCYRYGELLEGCVDSILGQKGVELRVLIIDDCSPDDTASVAERIAQRDSRVLFRRHAENMGLIGTANEGLQWAEDSDYVVLLSADDMLTPGALERAVTVMESHPEVGMVYGQAPYFESNDSLPRFGERWQGTKIWPGGEWIRRRCLAAKNCVCSPEVVVRTSVQRRVGEYSDEHRYTSDLDMWLRLAVVADVAYVKGAAQALYRVHDESMSRSMVSNGGLISDFEERRGVFEDFLAGPGAGIEDVASLRTMLARTLARQALWQASLVYDRGEVDGDGSAAVEDLIGFAQRAYAGSDRLPEWRGLQLRRRIGSSRSAWFPPFLLTRAGKRLHESFEWRRKQRLGV
jgi:glycosyltransferase involved in cell wall biosynthesis